MIGNRLKLARSATGLSLRALSVRIDNRVTAQAIGKYERDESMPSSGVLIALADALNVSVNYLVGDPGMTLLSVDYRNKTVESRREEHRITAMVLQMLERYLAIEEILGLPSVNWDKPRSAPYPVIKDLLEADRAASMLRNDWELGLNSIPNMAELMEERGVKVLFRPLEDGVDGFTAHVQRENGEDSPVIVANADHGGERQRFTIAHEIGHLMLDVSPAIDEEKAVYRFAGALLMPEEVMWAEIGRRRTALGWAELFKLKLMLGVSVQAISYRCKDLGIISASLMAEMFDVFRELGWRDPPYEEAHPIPGESSGRFERLCYRALAEGAISESKASELLEMSVHDLNIMMDDPRSSADMVAAEA